MRESIGVAAVLSAMALVVLDAGMVGVALPVIGPAFGETPARSLQVVTGYQLALLVALLPSAHVADRIGHRRLFLGGIALFGGSALLCALAPSFPLLVAARFLQGLGAAAVMALGIALLRNALGPDRLTAAIGWNALVVAFCSALGPAAGALLLSVASWRWLFMLALPIGAVALIAAQALPATKPVEGPFNLLGIVLYAVAAALLVIAGETARQAPFAAILPVIAALAFALWLFARERRAVAPILALDLLELRPFRLSATASVFFFVGQSAGLLALSFYLQLSLGRSATTAGLLLALWPLGVCAVSPIASRVADRFQSGSLCGAGAVLLAAGLAVIAWWPVQESVLRLAACAFAAGAGFGLFQVPNNRNMFLSAPPSRAAAAGGLQGTARLAGQTAGALLVAFVLSAFPIAIAPRLAFGLAAAAALVAAWLSLRQNVSAAHEPGLRTSLGYSSSRPQRLSASAAELSQ